MPGDLEGLAVGMALFEQEVELAHPLEPGAQFGSRSSGPVWLGRLTIKLSIVSALGFAFFSVAQALSVLL